MADNHLSDDSSNDGVDAVWSDSDNSHHNGETPPQSPVILNPYIDPDDITEIPHVLEGWRNDIGWPQYQPQPNDQREFPVTGEPAQQTMPIVVAKVNEVDDRLVALETEVEQKAHHHDITVTRQSIRDVRNTFTEYSEVYNQNLLVLENLQENHDSLASQYEVDYALSKKRRRTLNARLIVMEKKIAKLEAEKASTSRARKKRKTKKD